MLAVPIRRGQNVPATVSLTYFRSAFTAKRDKGRYVAAVHQMAENIEANVLALERQRSRRYAGEVHQKIGSSRGPHGSGAGA